MQHWNGNLLCAIDTETTGLLSGYHEIIQICILPLDSNIKPREDVTPFYIEIKPEHKERADPKAMKVNRLDFTTIARRGHDVEAAKGLLEKWIDGLGLPSTKFGTRKKLIPLGQNYGFDRAFITEWLGPELYDELFHHEYRDTKMSAAYLNDRAGMHAEKVPFNKLGLTWLAKVCNVPRGRAHDALADCVATAGVYRHILNQGLLG